MGREANKLALAKSVVTIGKILLTGETYLAIVTPLNNVLGNTWRIQTTESGQGTNLLVVWGSPI